MNNGQWELVVGFGVQEHHFHESIEIATARWITSIENEINKKYMGMVYEQLTTYPDLSKI